MLRTAQFFAGLAFVSGTVAIFFADRGDAITSTPRFLSTAEARAVVGGGLSQNRKDAYCAEDPACLQKYQPCSTHKQTDCSKKQDDDGMSNEACAKDSKLHECQHTGTLDACRKVYECKWNNKNPGACIRGNVVSTHTSALNCQSTVK
jgi:hypothetical protein